MTRTVPPALPAMTENDLLKSVKELAHIFGWWYHHPRYSIASSKGWPDVALIRPPRLILAELKTDKGKLTEAQQTVIAMLTRCERLWIDDADRVGLEVYVWRPKDLDDITRTLR